MSEKINYSFTPIPNYFRDHGWFKKPNCVAFVTWAFSRCSTFPRKVFHDHKEVNLDPFEFISGRHICSQETGLSDREIRTQLFHLEESGLLQKTTSKTTSKFSIYKWITTRFSDNTNHQTDQQPTSNRPATDHNQESRVKIIDIGLIDMIDNAQAREKKDEIQNEVEVEVDNSPLLVFKSHRPSGITSIRTREVNEELLKQGFSLEEINAAIVAMKEQDPKLSIGAKIINYLKSIVENQRKNTKERESHVDTKSSYKQSAKNSSRRENYKDPVERSRDSFKESSIRYPVKNS